MGGVELGQVESGKDKDKLRWRLVSLKGTSAYTYSTETPDVGSGSVFVQETALKTSTAVWDSNESSTNYFTSSSLRTSIKDGDLFSLTDTEKKYLGSYIKARTLTAISWSCVNVLTSTFTFPYTSVNSYENDNNYIDYFWLMSVGELYTYFKSTVSSVSEPRRTAHSEFVWKPSGSGVSFWLRSPCYDVSDGKYQDSVTCVDSDGYFYNALYSGYSYGVRAAFQLV